MLTLKNITYKKRRNTLLSNVSATVNRGDCITIFGPNGAGKSTLMQIMAGIMRPSSGKRQASFVKEHAVGYVPQQIALFEGLTVKDHLKFYQKLTKQTDEAYITELIQALGLENIMSKKVEKLSGGMKRKVNLAVGVIQKPEIIFLDEAFVGVDLAAKHEMLQWLKQLNERGLTIIFITHDWNNIHYLAKDMWILDDGKLLETISMDMIRDMKRYKKGSAELQKMFVANYETTANE